MKGYRSNLRNRFQDQVKQITEKNKLSELVLILDVNTAFILSTIFKVTELIAMKIHYIQRLQKKRKNLNKHGLYFITPQRDSVLAVSKDFESEKQQPQYRRVHILFSSFIDNSTLKILATNPFLMKKIAKNSIKQFYCSNKVLAENLIDIGTSYLEYGFSKDQQGEKLRRQKIAKGIIQYIANTKQINRVKIYYKKSPNCICDRMAVELLSVTKQYLGILIKNKSVNITKSAKDITFLLLDRSIDPITPALHYFTYEALLFDLFKVSMVGKTEIQDKQQYSYEQIQNQSYQKYRYRHISQALEKLPKSLDHQKRKLDGLKSDGHEHIDIRQMNEQINDLRTNIQKLQMIWNKFQQLNLNQLSELQLCLTTGLTSEGSNTSSSKILAQAQQLIKSKKYPQQINIRIAILCLCCIKLTKNDYIQLIDLFDKQTKQIFKNLNALGVTYDSKVSKSTKTITKQQQAIAKQRMQKTGMPLNRYTSIIQLVLPLFVRVLTDPLSQATIDPQIFGEYQASIFQQSQSSNGFDDKKFCIVMIGGMSWAEVSALRCLSEVESCVLMTDRLYNPKQYIQCLKGIQII